MNRFEFRAARVKLGLTQIQLSKLLETDLTSIARIEGPEINVKARKPSPRMGALLTAYLSGFRPDNWPLTNGG